MKSVPWRAASARTAVCLAAVCLAAVLMPHAALAHEFRPAQVRVELDPAQVTWVAEADRLAGHRPRLTLEGCRPTHQHAEVGVQQVLRLRYDCPAPPPALVVEDLPADLKVVVTLGERTAIIDASAPRFPLTRPPPPPWRRFVPIGIEHILLGFDHLLFVLAFMLVVASRRRLFVALSGFTLGHTLTLAAATLGWVEVPGPPVEAVIALSVVFLAAEAARQRPTFTHRHPLVVATAFGLLHGLGFAGALADILTDQARVVGPLVGFNLGVELGQIAFVIMVLGVAALAKRWAPWLNRAPGTVRRLVAWSTGALAGFWVWDRVAAFFGA